MLGVSVVNQWALLRVHKKKTKRSSIYILDKLNSQTNSGQFLISYFVLIGNGNREEFICFESDRISQYPGF